MTNEEAIKQIEQLKYDMENFWEIKYESMGMAIEAMQKQVPQPPNIAKDTLTDSIMHYYCPSCGRYFGRSGTHNMIVFAKENYCQRKGCGQRIDWAGNLNEEN